MVSQFDVHQDYNFHPISLSIHITCLLDNVRILEGKVTCESLLRVLIGYGAAMKTSSQGTWQVLIRNFTMITASKQWKKKMQFYWSISGNTTVLCHLRVFPVVCGRCDVFRPIYNFRCNCSVLGVFIIKLMQLLLFLRWQLNNRKLTGNR